MQINEFFLTETSDKADFVRVSGNIPMGNLYGLADRFFFYSNLLAITISKKIPKGDGGGQLGVLIVEFQAGSFSVTAPLESCEAVALQLANRKITKLEVNKPIMPGSIEFSM